MIARSSITAAVAFFFAPTTALASEDVVVEPLEKWTNFFSGAEAKLHYAVRAAQPLDGRVNWSLSLNRRTLEHRQVSLTVEPGRVSEAPVAFKMPEVKEGVILGLDLNVAVYAGDDQKPVAQHARKVWAFPRDPFANRSEWLKSLKITLFDPEARTADVMEKAHVPFTFTKNPASLDDLNKGMLVIGEGTALRDYRSLGESMVKAAARGLPVLCLAPGDGSLVLPGTVGADMPSPVRLTLRRDDVIAELDKRLDFAAWPPKGLIDFSRLQIRSDRDQVVAKASQNPMRGPGWKCVTLPAKAGYWSVDLESSGNGTLPPHPAICSPNCCSGFPVKNRQVLLLGMKGRIEHETARTSVCRVYRLDPLRRGRRGGG